MSRSYTIGKNLLTAKQIKFIYNKIFAKTALDENINDFILQMSFFSHDSVN